ncbi:hypothetical protein [Streptomyces torulosus]|uniref:hypothetical protein n=1 Tax=Streptomyces torulosus TaxID=68276 RepID=UPI0006EB93A4|nr:hypothetical protein [Streptomyces torulosus]
MKSLKAAAVVAGSIALAGASAPAFADTADLMPPSLAGATKSVSKTSLDVVPMRHQTNALDTENKGSVLNAVNGATKSLNAKGGPTRLLGGLPLQR